MKIEQVESIRIGHCIPGAHPYRHRAGPGWARRRAGATRKPVESIVGRMEAYLVGQDPLRIEHHWQANNRAMPFRGAALSGAISAVDIALWDIKGKHYGAPSVGPAGGQVQGPHPPAPADGQRRYAGLGRC